VGKSGPKIWPTFAIFKKLLKENNDQKTRILAQSGHTAAVSQNVFEKKSAM
jgi:hypothetical protein